jgi:hypothetical protein
LVGNQYILGVTGPTFALGSDSTEFLGVDDPVVELEGVHRLQDGRDATDVGVDLCVGQEVGCLKF